MHRDNRVLKIPAWEKLLAGGRGGRGIATSLDHTPAVLFAGRKERMATRWKTFVLLATPALLFLQILNACIRVAQRVLLNHLYFSLSSPELWSSKRIECNLIVFLLVCIMFGIGHYGFVRFDSRLVRGGESENQLGFFSGLSPLP